MVGKLRDGIIGEIMGKFNNNVGGGKQGKEKQKVNSGKDITNWENVIIRIINIIFT